MSVATEEEARRTLSPLREARLFRAFHAAWDDVAEDQARYSIWPRTRANMIFERLAVRLQEQFTDDPGVFFCFADETVKVTFDDFLLVRCKKANDRGLGQNVPTQANISFCEADEDLSLFPGLKKVEIAYVLNGLGVAIQTVVVQARDGNMRLWAYSIDDALPSEGSAPIVPFPTPPSRPTQPDGSDLVQPRKPATEQDDKDKK